jgi:hypothetical protein
MFDRGQPGQDWAVGPRVACSEQLVPECIVPRPRPAEAGELLERTGLGQRRALVGSHRCTFFRRRCPLPSVQNALAGACPRLPAAISGKPTLLRCCAGSKTKESEIAAVLGITEKTVSAHLHRAPAETDRQARARLPASPRRSGRTIVITSGGHRRATHPRTNCCPGFTNS